MWIRNIAKLWWSRIDMKIRYLFRSSEQSSSKPRRSWCVSRVLAISEIIITVKVIYTPLPLTYLYFQVGLLRGLCPRLPHCLHLANNRQALEDEGTDDDTVLDLQTIKNYFKLKKLYYLVQQRKTIICTQIYKQINYVGRITDQENMS